MSWTVGATPKKSSAFFSPWFGMDPSDNLNLIQPVNPYSSGFFGGGWSMYTEYFQWSPQDNSNSKSHTVKSVQTLHGSLDYDASSDSYTLSQVRWKNRAKRKRERGQRDLCRAGLSMSALSMRRDGPFAPSFGHRASLPVALLRSPNVPSLAPFRPASAPLPPRFRPASALLPPRFRCHLTRFALHFS